MRYSCMRHGVPHIIRVVELSAGGVTSMLLSSPMSFSISSLERLSTLAPSLARSVKHKTIINTHINTNIHMKNHVIQAPSKLLLL